MADDVIIEGDIEAPPEPGSSDIVVAPVIVIAPDPEPADEPADDDDGDTDSLVTLALVVGDLAAKVDLLVEAQNAPPEIIEVPDDEPAPVVDENGEVIGETVPDGTDEDGERITPKSAGPHALFKTFAQWRGKS